MDSSNKSFKPVHSVDRAISILQVLAQHGPLAITELAAQLNIHKSTAFRLLATLEARGLVEQSASRGKYQLGFGVVGLAEGATGSQDLTVRSRPICEELAVEVSETVNLVINDGSGVVSVDQAMGGSAVAAINWVGRKGPLHATSAGKVFLAFMTEEQTQEALPKPLERYTEHTVTDTSELFKQLATVRDSGWCFTVEEDEVGLSAVSAPVRGHDGSVIAALSVSGPTFRVNEETLPALVDQVVDAALRISIRNGYPKQG